MKSSIHALIYVCLRLLFIPIIISSFPVCSQTTLIGDIHSYNFNVKGNPYIVKENIIIPSGTACTIPAGCVFIFHPFTGLTVEGTLTVNGTKEMPVVFSSINDSMFNPGSFQSATTFDWNGIIIAAESYGSSFMHTKITYSVYGLKSQTPNITLTDCIFSQNGQYHFTIKDQIQNVLENLPFSYISEAQKTATPFDSLPQQTTSRLKIALQIGSLAVGIAGIAGGTVLYNKMKVVDHRIESMTVSNTTEKKYAEENSRRKKLSAQSIAGFVLGGLGTAGFGISFVF
jgi:hypothetical protein